MTQLSLSPNNVDLTDAELFERNEAHDVFRMLRREAPVHWNPANDVMKGFWNVTKYADVVEISRNPELFISSKGITQLDPVEPSPFDAAAQGLPGSAVPAGYILNGGLVWNEELAAGVERGSRAIVVTFQCENTGKTGGAEDAETARLR